jgi:Cu/Ag efflux pump CusA
MHLGSPDHSPALGLQHLTQLVGSCFGLALVPIALSAGEPGSEIQAPMAMVIMFGLLSSTALNMIVVPILYERFGRPVAASLGDAR